MMYTASPVISKISANKYGLKSIQYLLFVFLGYYSGYISFLLLQEIHQKVFYKPQMEAIIF